MADAIFIPDKRRMGISTCTELGFETDDHGQWKGGRTCSHGFRAPHALTLVPYHDNGPAQNELSLTAGVPRFKCQNEKCQRVFIARSIEPCPACNGPTEPFVAGARTTKQAKVAKPRKPVSSPAITIPEVEVKRGRGRPKGSLNKKTLAKLGRSRLGGMSAEGIPGVKRPTQSPPPGSAEETPLDIPVSGGRESILARLRSRVADAQANS